MTTEPLAGVTLTFSDVFPGDSSTDVFFSKTEWIHPVTLFVGRNGSGKSRVAKIVANRLDGHRLSTDRLSGLMTYTNWGWTSAPNPDQMHGVPLGDSERSTARQIAKEHGSAIDEMYVLKEQPEVGLRVAAFIRRALGRVVVMKEKSGFLDPHIRMGGVEYSLFRDEGHGLRELVILLTAVYRSDWRLLVVDEPELHLHPSMVRLWLGEVERVCSEEDRRAVIVTHEPSLVRPKTASDLEAVYYFSAGKAATAISSATRPETAERVTASLRQNPELISQLVFSPRPVLVEGSHDVGALTVALTRTQPPEVVAQTDLVDCVGSGTVSLWFEIADALDIDVRAVADLDACLDSAVQRVMDRSIDIQDHYKNDLAAEPPRTSTVLAPLIPAMNADGVPKSPKERAMWLSRPPSGTGHEARIAKLVAIWKENNFWLHAQGTLEDVLGIEDKGREQAQTAAQQPGAIDDVAKWCAYKLDTSGEIRDLLGVAVERIAHDVMEAQRDEPGSEYRFPVGGPDSADARLVSLEPIGDGKHRLTVLKPDDFAGYWLEFSRDTRSSDLILKEPDGDAQSSSSEE